jgi:Ser/Thr protein kinase RdoA (MazF antagonist)
MNNLNSLSFSQLDAGLVQDAMLSAGYACDGRMLVLNSYENRVYQLGIEDDAPVIAKFYRPHRWSDAAILEEHAFVDDLVADEIPAVPALLSADGASLFHYQAFRFSVFKRHGGRAPELDQPDVLERLGRLIGRIHAVGARSGYQERPTLNAQTFGEQPIAFLLEQCFIPKELIATYQAVTAAVLDGVARCFEQAGEFQSLRLHGDCHLGNVLWTDAGAHFVDFDDSRMGPAMQDIWMLLSGTRAEMTAQLCDVVAGYEDFFEFKPRQLHLIEALRSLRLLHYSAWLAQRWDDPAFKLAFPWFNTTQYWQERILELQEQVVLMNEPPLRI